MSLATSKGPALAVFCHLHGTTWVASQGTTGVARAGLVEARDLAMTSCRVTWRSLVAFREFE